MLVRRLHVDLMRIFAACCPTFADFAPRGIPRSHPSS